MAGISMAAPHQDRLSEKGALRSGGAAWGIRMPQFAEAQQGHDSVVNALISALRVTASPHRHTFPPHRQPTSARPLPRRSGRSTGRLDPLSCEIHRPHTTARSRVATAARVVSNASGCRCLWPAWCLHHSGMWLAQSGSPERSTNEAVGRWIAHTRGWR
jgi:hypothetical protein